MTTPSGSHQAQQDQTTLNSETQISQTQNSNNGNTAAGMQSQESDERNGDLDQLTVNTIRFLSIDMVQQANSGHPGLPLGAAPMAYVLWSRFLKYNPKDWKWMNRDRFILSAGHGSALLYSLLHLSGYDLPMEEIKRFRQMGSKTPGHPESLLTPGVEVTTGPLGQGFGNAVGSAITEAFLSATYNREGHQIVDHYTYTLVSDGDLMEGVASEASSLAGHLKLGKLIALYDDNHISLDGATSMAFTENRMMRYEAYGWHTQQVEDGNNLDEIDAAIRHAQEVKDKPSIIAVRTIIGFGSPLADTSKAHGSPLGEENVKKTKQTLGWDPEKKFFVPDGVYEHMRHKGKEGAQKEEEWKSLYEAYAKQFPKEGAEIGLIQTFKLPENWDAGLPQFGPADGALATRQASGKALEAFKKTIPFLIGGSADLASSNEMPVKNDLSFQPGHYSERNVWFGVREHGMGAVLNGMLAHQGIKVYGGTFLTFSDYMRGSIRLAALTEAPVIYVFTHDSIGMGEDGPTHQSVEQVAALRAIPNLVVIRPGDANETVYAWRTALAAMHHPTALILSRQKMPVLDQTKYPSASQVEKGAYILKDSDKDAVPDLIILATGSELHLALEAYERLKQELSASKIRVVSIPSFELFNRQDDAYKEQILPRAVRKRLSVEAGVAFGWQQYLGLDGKAISIDRFGESAPGEEVMKKFGFTVDNVVDQAKILLAK